jgi:hypothetical protein
LSHSDKTGNGIHEVEIESILRLNIRAAEDKALNMIRAQMQVTMRLGALAVVSLKAVMMAQTSTVHNPAISTTGAQALRIDISVMDIKRLRSRDKEALKP